MQGNGFILSGHKDNMSLPHCLEIRPQSLTCTFLRIFCFFYCLACSRALYAMDPRLKRFALESLLLCGVVLWVNIVLFLIVQFC